MKRLLLLIPVICLPLLACGTDTSPGSPATNANNDPIDPDKSITIDSNGDSGTRPLSTLSLKLTDAAIDSASKVVISIIAIELIRETPAYTVTFQFDTPLSIDLLTLQGTATETLLSEVDIVSGEYDEIRLLIDDSASNTYIELKDGNQHDLKIPSGTSSGLKVKGGIIVPENRPASYTLDFDVRQSIVQAGNSSNYLLKPVLRLVDDSTVGHLSGSVDSALLTAASCSDDDVDTGNAVYLFEGHNIAVDDIDLNDQQDIDPVATATVSYDNITDRYRYEIAFLTEGDYTIAVTCNADLEDLEANDDLQFFNIQNVTIQVNDTLFL